MSVISLLSDGYKNLVANLGTSRDKSASGFYGTPSLTPDQCLSAYRGAWLPRKIVDIPAKDSCRKWRAWQADKDQINAIEEIERLHNVKGKTLAAKIAARLYGGAAIYIGTGDSNPEMPLIPERVGKDGLQHLTVLTHNQITAGDIDRDPESEYFNRPKFYRLNTGDQAHVQIHPSRLVKFIGAPIPDDGVTQGTIVGWGDPVLMSVFDAIKHADSTAANIAALVFEAKIDVIGIPELASRITEPGYEQALQQMLALSQMMKGINGTMVMDAASTYEQKQATFATLPDIMDRFYQAVSGAADIPITRLFGQAPAGMNSTGEGDLRNYYDHIQSMQELEMTPAMAVMDEVIIRSALGNRPDELFYTWNSLWQTTEKERAEVGEITARTASTLAGAGILSDQVIARATSNALIESGALPGLEAAVDEFGDDPGEFDDLLRTEVPGTEFEI